MLHRLKKIVLGIGGLSTVLTLSACGGALSMSHVSNKGTAEHPVWPDPTHATFKNGSFPNLDSLRLVSDGMTKDQIYNLLGRPHFDEGVFNVHEWDYLFHFRTHDGVSTCQYKILFDEDMLARSFLWKPKGCASILDASRPTPAPPSSTQ